MSAVKCLSQIGFNGNRKIKFFVTWKAVRAGQDEPNPVLSLAIREGKLDEAILPARDYPFCSRNNISPNFKGVRKFYFANYFP